MVLENINNLKILKKTKMNNFKDFYESQTELYSELNFIYTTAEEDQEFGNDLVDYVLSDDSNDANDANDVNEVLSPTARRHKSAIMKRLAKRLAKARKRKQNKAPTKEEITNKARRTVIAGLKKKLSGGKELTLAQKEKIEKTISSGAWKKKIEVLAKKNIQQAKSDLMAARQKPATDKPI